MHRTGEAGADHQHSHSETLPGPPVRTAGLGAVQARSFRRVVVAQDGLVDQGRHAGEGGAPGQFGQGLVHLGPANRAPRRCGSVRDRARAASHAATNSSGVEATLHPLQIAVVADPRR